MAEKKAVTKTTDEAFQEANANYFELRNQRLAIQKKEEEARAEEAFRLIGQGNAAVEGLATMDLKYSFGPVTEKTRKPRGPNKKKSTAVVNGAASNTEQVDPAPAGQADAALSTQ